MQSRYSGAVTGGIQTLFRVGVMGTSTDGQLVAHLLAGREESQAALRILLERHGPMVLGVCQRLLGNAHAAEDAFQVTFLILVKKAGTLQHRELLANWLYGVARRVAAKAKSEAARRQVVESRAAKPAIDPTDDPDRAELLAVIDEEIHRLPERYRVPLVLCHLEGMQHHEVARRLGCPVGTVESRLSRAREQLRGRLARRGLAPATSVLAAILTPSETSAAPPSLVLATLRAAAELSPARRGIALASLVSLAHGKLRSVPWLYPIALVPTLVVCAGMIALGGRDDPAVETSPPEDSTQNTPQLESASVETPVTAKESRERKPTPSPLRSPSAVAVPLAGLTIDGRLDDWPQGLKKHPIRNRLTGLAQYSAVSRSEIPDEDAYFTAGYNREAGLIYLAVVVPDDILLTNPNDFLGTDAVEVYLDGTFSDRAIPTGKWSWDTLNAARMPVVQYVAIPAPGRAYSDPWGANPSLVYGKISDTATKMAYRRQAGVTVYEWAVEAFDRYPSQPTELVPGKRVGLEVVVVDKDRIQHGPTWTSWGAPPRVFKGVDAGSLGELILSEGP